MLLSLVAGCRSYSRYPIGRGVLASWARVTGQLTLAILFHGTLLRLGLGPRSWTSRSADSFYPRSGGKPERLDRHEPSWQSRTEASSSTMSMSTTFTVSNRSGQARRGRARLVPSVDGRRHHVGSLHRDVGHSPCGIVATPCGIASTLCGIGCSLCGIVTSQSDFVSSQSGIATSQSKNVTLQSENVTSQSDFVTSQSGIATSQSDFVTSQSGFVTSQCGIATSQSGIASSQRGIASSQ